MADKKRLDSNKGGKEVLEIYMKIVSMGLKTIDEVPEKYRELIRKELNRSDNRSA